MPIIQFSLLEGRTLEQKRQLAKRVSETVCEVLGCKPQSVRILINELAPDHFSVGGVTAAEGGLVRQSPGADPQANDNKAL